MDGNARQPCGKGRFAGKLVQVFVGADVSILDHVLGLAVVPKDCTRHAVQPLVVAPHDDLKKSGLPLQNSAYSLLVTQFQKSRLKHWAGSHETPPPRIEYANGKKVTLFAGLFSDSLLRASGQPRTLLPYAALPTPKPLVADVSALSSLRRARTQAAKAIRTSRTATSKCAPVVTSCKAMATSHIAAT